MGTYGFYSNSDHTKEIIFRSQFKSLMEAVVEFAAMKQLTIDDFLNLFTVIRLK